jgi:mono/diheme cytochrome c family protein
MRRTIAAVILAIGLVPTVAAAEPAIGRTFKAKCASCHGEDGKGKTKEGEKQKIGDMTSADWQKSLTDEKMKAAILDGFTREKGGVKQEMRPLKDKLTPEQVDALVGYVRGLKP